MFAPAFAGSSFHSVVQGVMELGRHFLSVNGCEICLPDVQVAFPKAANVLRSVAVSDSDNPIPWK
jgi:hypothetical protein